MPILRALPTPDPRERPKADKERAIAFLGDDTALVSAIRSGMVGSDAVLFDRYGSYVQRLIAHILGPGPDVADVVHDSFLRIWEGLNELRDSSALKGWVGSVAIFTARSFLRQRMFRRRILRFLPASLIPELPASIAPPEVHEALRRTYVLIETLPADEQIAFALRFVEGMELAAIADACAVSLSTVKRRLERAERTFLEGARRDPELSERLERGERWSVP